MKNILIGLTVFGLALGIGLFAVSYATELTVNEMSESIESTVDNFEESVEVKIDSLETKVFGDDNHSDDDDYDHKDFEMKGEYHSERNAIFEDNQVTQEEIDALTYTKLKEHLLVEFATELEDGVITEDELKSGHENHKGKGHKKGRGMHGHDHDYNDDDNDTDDDD